MVNLISDTIKFWEYKHRIKDNDSLSGCGYDETIDFLKIRDCINIGCNVLEIGVGLGYVTNGLYENGANVSAVDISDLALSNVAKYCEKIYNVKELSNLPTNYYDVIICNNVVQHVPTDLLIEELKEIMRSLKDDGILAIEFVSSDTFEDNGLNPTLENIQTGRLCRKPNFIENIIKTFGDKCKLVFDRKIDVFIIKGHHVFHVRKK